MYKLFRNREITYEDGITIYPRNVFSGRDWFTGEYSIDDNTIGVHHCAGGCLSDESKKISDVSKINMKHLGKIK